MPYFPPHHFRKIPFEEIEIETFEEMNKRKFLEYQNTIMKQKQEAFFGIDWANGESEEIVFEYNFATGEHRQIITEDAEFEVIEDKPKQIT